MNFRPFALTVTALLLAGCGGNSDVTQYGPNPDLPETQRGLLPKMTIADPAGWGDRRPVVPDGYTITPIAAKTGMSMRRNTARYLG